MFFSFLSLLLRFTFLYTIRVCIGHFWFAITIINGYFLIWREPRHAHVDHSDPIWHPTTLLDFRFGYLDTKLIVSFPMPHFSPLIDWHSCITLFSYHHIIAHSLPTTVLL